MYYDYYSFNLMHPDFLRGDDYVATPMNTLCTVTYQPFIKSLTMHNIFCSQKILLTHSDTIYNIVIECDQEYLRNGTGHLYHPLQDNQLRQKTALALIYLNFRRFSMLQSTCYRCDCVTCVFIFRPGG